MTTLGDALSTLHDAVLGPDAPESRASRWLAEHSKAGTLRRAVAGLGLTVEEGPGFAYRLYEAVRDHFTKEGIDGR